MRTTKPVRGILLVGEEKNERELLAGVLEKAGHTVHLVADGKEALRVLAERRIQLVISDHDTPAIRGIDLLSLVRQRYPHVSQIALVEKGSFDAVAGSISYGETGQVLQKPCSPVQLKGAVYLALQTVAAEAENRELVAALQRHIDFLDALSRQLDFSVSHHDLASARPFPDGALLPLRKE